MPTYCYRCPNCGERKEVVRPMKHSDLPEWCNGCQCGRGMDRDPRAEHCAVRGDYNDPIVSESMAFDAIDLAEHRRRFPGVEVQVDHARSARPIFRSLTQRRDYMKKRNWIDQRSYV